MDNTKNQSITAFNDGNKLYKAKLFQEALDKYSEALKIDLTLAVAHFAYAKTLVRLKRANEALDYFKKYIELFPKEEQAKYIIGFSKILQQEDEDQLVEFLIQESQIKPNANNLKDYLELLFNNAQIQKGNYLLMKLKDDSLAARTYQEIIDSTSLKPEILQKLNSASILERYWKISFSLKTILKTSAIESAFIKEIREQKTILETLRNNESAKQEEEISYLEKRLNAIINKIAESTLSDAQSGDIKKVKPKLEILEKLGYQNQQAKKAEEVTRKQNRKRQNKIIVSAGIALIGVIILAVGFHFFYNSYKKKQLYTRALESKELFLLDRYKSRYGSNNTIDSLREEAYHQEIIRNPTTSEIIYFQEEFPNSNKLRLIRFPTNQKNTENRLLGANSEGKNNEQEISKFPTKVPVGARIIIRRIKGEGDNITIEKAFTVHHNTRIESEPTWPNSNQIYDFYTSNNYQPINYKKNFVYYCWVNELNVRTGDGIDYPIKETIIKGEPVRFLGNIGTQYRPDTYFNNEFRPAYFVEIEMLNGEKGWVHGGGLNEVKGIYNIDWKELKSYKLMHSEKAKEFNKVSSNKNSLNTKEKIYDYKIQQLINAEETRDFNKIANFYSFPVKRYWETKNVSRNDLLKRYEYLWGIVDSDKNIILSIKKLNKNDYIYIVEYSFYQKKKNKYKTVKSEIHISFNNQGKITSIYGKEI